MSKVSLPWSQISKPSSAVSLNKRRVDADLTGDFWWTKSFENQVGLRIEFKEKLDWSQLLDRYEHFEAVFDLNTASFSIIHFTEKSKTIDVFFDLSMDIINFVENFSGKRNTELLNALFLRLEKWKLLFNPVSTSFTESQQIGLLGELSLINDTLLAEFDYKQVLNIWRGPIPEPQDFISNNWAIEVKAQWAQSHPVISINSLKQLDILNGPIFISHRKFTPSIEPSKFNLSLKTQIDLILDKIGGDNFYINYFLSLLKNIGYDFEASYTKKEYVLQHSNYYKVTKDFPCLMRSNIPATIVDASYKLDLDNLDSFKVINLNLSDGSS